MTGEPLGDPAWVATARLAERAAHDVKMVLVGEGGDEVFGGYPTYLGALLAERFDRLPTPLRRGIAWLTHRLPVSDRKVTLSFILKRFVDGEGMEPLARHLLWTSAIPPALLERLGVELPTFRMPPVVGAVLDAVQRHDLESYLAEGLLTKADRASLGWALEPRAPFLDRAVMEFAATLPPGERVRGLTTKVFLKRYASRYLPRSIIHQRKRGLSVPLAAWFRGPLYEWARERLGSGLLRACGVTPRAGLDLLEEHNHKRADRARSLWILLVLANGWSGGRPSKPVAKRAMTGSDMVSREIPCKIHFSDPEKIIGPYSENLQSFPLSSSPGCQGGDDMLVDKWRFSLRRSRSRFWYGSRQY